MGYVLTPADSKLLAVIGDYPHANDGCPLAGGVADDAATQRLWKRAVQLALTPYDVPKGVVGRRFVKLFATMLKGIR